MALSKRGEGCSGRSFFYCRFFLAVLCTLAVARTPAGQRDRAADQESEDPDLPLLGLPIGSRPASLISFNVPDKSGRYLFSARLAVLDADPATRNQRIEIFKVVHGKLESEFSHELERGPVIWEELESFPTGGQIPGVVIWGGADVGRTRAIIVAYVRGKFEVVFQGYDLQLIDLGLTGVPEAIAADYPTSDYGSSTMCQVSTWTGDRYVPVAHVPCDQIFSREVLRAVKAVQAVRAKKK